MPSSKLFDTVLTSWVDKGDRDGRDHDWLAERRQDVLVASPCSEYNQPTHLDVGTDGSPFRGESSP